MKSFNVFIPLTLNNFVWGPDGWHYGTQSVFNFSNVGKPGGPATQRALMGTGIFRHHRDKKNFERYAEGGDNPWCLDWDDDGCGCYRRLNDFSHVTGGSRRMLYQSP